MFFVLFFTCPGTANYSLAGSLYDSEGRVEVILNGTQVASICDSLWGIEEANVVCKSLNYTGADRAYFSRFFSGDPGNSSVYNDVTCTGLEDHLLQCNYTYDEDSNCPYSGKGAGVMCTAHGMACVVVDDDDDDDDDDEQHLYSAISVKKHS